MEFTNTDKFESERVFHLKLFKSCLLKASVVKKRSLKSVYTGGIWLSQSGRNSKAVADLAIMISGIRWELCYRIMDT
ncbi:hypothetical protein K0M31_017798 [Melipona bicolor]|uniref:Uncharacterized protein n=1 Tax=Melipona bicolor TaxID=60889 RepID=A0AA40G5J8_9HYME|nr:hypothetical protein K0M31_017798 [Melipona bicolor]